MPQPQEYTVSTWSAWQDRDNDGEAVRDIHGNFKGSVTFEEDKSEPIDATFKIQPNPGDKKYGTVDLYQTRAGKTRKGFKSAPRPQLGYAGAPVQGGQIAAKHEWQPDSPEKQDSIARSVALKAAVDAAQVTQGPGVAISEDGIIKTAEIFLAWLKNEPTPASGYDKARQQAQQIRERLPEPSTMPFEGEQYPIDDVPPEYR